MRLTGLPFFPAWLVYPFAFSVPVVEFLVRRQTQISLGLGSACTPGHRQSSSRGPTASVFPLALNATELPQESPPSAFHVLRYD